MPHLHIENKLFRLISFDVHIQISTYFVFPIEILRKFQKQISAVLLKNISFVNAIIMGSYLVVINSYFPKTHLNVDFIPDLNVTPSQKILRLDSFHFPLRLIWWFADSQTR